MTIHDVLALLTTVTSEADALALMSRAERVTGIPSRRVFSPPELQAVCDVLSAEGGKIAELAERIMAPRRAELPGEGVGHPSSGSSATRSTHGPPSPEGRRAPVAHDDAMPARLRSDDLPLISDLLLIEDDDDDAWFVSETLADAGLESINLVRCQAMADVASAVDAQDFDVILLDLFLPDSQGLETLERVREITADIAIVVLTGLDDESIAFDAIQTGAQDFLPKSQLSDKLLVRTIRHAVERQRLRSKLESARVREERIARHDALTGLPNRANFFEQLTQAMSLAARQHDPLSILFIDLDGFKAVNDSSGHDAGDALLRSAASRISEALRVEDTAARIGGDEFMVLMRGTTDIQGAAVVARRLAQDLKRPYQIGGRQTRAPASIGISLFPHDGTSAEELMRAADIAMYRAKESGGGTFSFYSPEMGAAICVQEQFEQDLNAAVAAHEFETHFQPQVDLRSGAISGAEALMRWHHPLRGSVSPEQFIPVAEKLGLIVPLGAWGLTESWRQALTWDAAGSRVLKIATNVSPQELLAENFLSHFEESLATTGIPPQLVEVELTEAAALDSMDVAVSTMLRLREAGVSIAIDDFGVGQSSFSYLKELPIDTLKIDRSFVRDLTSDRRSRAIVEAVVTMAQSLDLRVVAEGIEDHDQLGILRDIGCDEGQGFLFSRAIPATDFAALVRTNETLIRDAA